MKLKYLSLGCLAFSAVALCSLANVSTNVADNKTAIVLLADSTSEKTFTAHTLVITDSLWTGYYINNEFDGVDVWVSEDDAKNKVEATVLTCNYYQKYDDNEDLYVLKKLSYQNLVDDLYARAYTLDDKGVKTYEDTDTLNHYSMITYCNNKRNSTNTQVNGTITLGEYVEGIVEYATLCQKFNGYKLDTLACDVFESLDVIKINGTNSSKASPYVIYGDEEKNMVVESGGYAKFLTDGTKKPSTKKTTITVESNGQLMCKNDGMYWETEECNIDFIVKTGAEVAFNNQYMIYDGDITVEDGGLADFFGGYYNGKVKLLGTPKTSSYTIEIPSNPGLRVSYFKDIYCSAGWVQVIFMGVYFTNNLVLEGFDMQTKHLHHSMYLKESNETIRDVTYTFASYYDD